MGACAGRISVAVLAILAALQTPALTQAPASVPSPSELLKIGVGADGVLASYEEIVSYLRTLDFASDRITVQELARTSAGLPYVVAIIASPETQQKIEQFRAMNNQLYDSRRVDEGAARRLVADGKTIVSIQMSGEAGAAQASMELAYRLATENSARVKAILDNTILVLSPSSNPDGTQMVAEWNHKTRGTKHEGTSPPSLLQKYAGPDLDRDWYLFTQNESRIWASNIWNYWRPQVNLDVREVASTGARIFVPPFMDGPDPNVDPTLRAQSTALGSAIASELVAKGKDGVVSHATREQPAPANGYVQYHGGVHMVVEVASARMASPLALNFDQLGRGIGYDAKEVTWNFPRPWRGGMWRLRDIMDYEHAAIDAVLDHAARNREQWLGNFHRANLNAVGRKDPATGQEKPFAIVVPGPQKDPATTSALLRALQVGDVEIARAGSAFAADGRTFAPGAHVILLAQPASPFARTLTEAHPYPAVSLPLLMGVETVSIQRPFDTALERISGPIVVPPGDAGPRSARTPRIGVYQSYLPSADEGWTRWIFDQLKVPYTTVHNTRMRAPLGTDFDVIVLPDQDATAIVNGHPAGTMPDEYAGGIGEQGVTALRAFVEAGGTLVAVDSATELPIARFGLPVKNVLAGVDAPGSIIKTVVTPKHPITAGAESDGTAWFEQSPAFDVGPGATAVVRYPAQGDPRLTGTFAGSVLNGKAAVVEAQLGKGRVILFGFRPQYRAQTINTSRLLINAVYSAGSALPAEVTPPVTPRRNEIIGGVPPPKPDDPRPVPRVENPRPTPTPPLPRPDRVAQPGGGCPLLGTLAVTDSVPRKGNGFEARNQLAPGQERCYEVNIRTRGDLEVLVDFGYKVEADGLVFKDLKGDMQRYSRLDVTPNTRLTIRVRNETGGPGFVLSLYIYPN